MRAALSALDSGSRTLSCFLGVVVLGLFGAALATALDPGEVMRWAREVFGVTFLVALSVLVVVARRIIRPVSLLAKAESEISRHAPNSNPAGIKYRLNIGKLIGKMKSSISSR